MAPVVLLADPEGDVRAALADFLDEHGLRTLQASDAQELLEQAARADIILMDAALSDEDALDLVRQLHESPETREKRVLLQATEKTEGLENSALEAGADAVLEKPLDYDVLLQYVEKSVPAEAASEAMPRPAQASEQQIVEFLGEVLQEGVPAIRAAYDPDSSYGYSYPVAEDFFGLSSEQALQLLEDLAAEGLLQRRLADKIHLCPDCGWHTLNFVEICARCGALDINIERVLHHFACGYVGPWSEFREGVDLICPKCEEELRHMGLDYERPSDTYVCRDCDYVFTDSRVQAKCLHCEHTENAEAIAATRIFDFVPTAKANRAVEYGQLRGLDIESVVFEDQSRTFRRDFLVFEIDREIYRARRYESELSLMLIDLQGIEQAPDVGDRVDRQRVQREMFEAVSDALRDLDVVSSVEEGWAAVLLPETPLEGAVKVGNRIHQTISDFEAVNLTASLTTTIAVGTLQDEHQSGQEFFQYVHEILVWALEHQPGRVASAETWEEEAG